MQSALGLGLLAVGLASFGGVQALSQDAAWEDRFGLPNLNASLYALGKATDGRLYVGGYFAPGGGRGLNAHYVASWDGLRWSRLGSDGITNGTSGPVMALLSVGTNSYVGGEFGTVSDGIARSLVVNGIAAWDGTRWGPLGSGDACGVVGAVYALATDGTNLLVGGRFMSAGAVNTTNIARWDGQQWSALGAGLGNFQADRVSAIAVVPNGAVYAAGNFLSSGGVALNRVAEWNGSNWIPLGSGVDNIVYALAFYNGSLYAGGQFTTADGTAANGLAKWDGNQWSEVGGGVSGRGVFALAATSAGLYVGGNLSAAGTTSVAGIARWDGANWASVGNGVSGGSSATVYALLADGDAVYAAGDFTMAGDAMVTRVAIWDGEKWSALNFALDEGRPTSAFGVAARGTNAFVIGEFAAAGGVPANRIARWDGNQWSALGTSAANGLDGPALTVALASKADVYAAGSFTKAGDVSALNIARWDGSNWRALGAGIFGTVRAVAVTSNDWVYAGGIFGNAGSVSANNIALWDGANWSALGEGLTRANEPPGPIVLAMAVDGSSVYVGGSFDRAGGQAVTNIARWDGSRWVALGSGVDAPNFSSSVQAIAVSGSNVYVGGAFTRAGGVPVSRLARWDGQNWTDLGGGTDSDVYAIATSGEQVFITGNFHTVGTRDIPGLARWLGGRWWSFGSGLGGDYPYGTGLAVTSESLFVTGRFTETGQKPATYFGRWSLANSAPLIELTGPSNGYAFTTSDPIGVTVDVASPNGAITLVQFYAGPTLIGSASAKPFGFVWLNPTPGDHLLTAKATDQAGLSATSIPVAISVRAATVGPTISGQPASQTVNNGANVTLQVEASGTGLLRFQWRKDGAALPRATNATLVLPAVGLADSARYVATVTDDIGTNVSAEAVISVLQPVTTVWAQPFGVKIHSSPAIGEGGTVYLGSDNQNLYAFAANRAYLWRFPTDDYVQSSAALGTNGTIYFGCHDRRVYALTPDGTKQWEFLTGFTVVGSPAIGSDGTIYVGSGDQKLYALNPDGTKRWEYATQGEIDSSPALAADGTIYITSSDRKLYALMPNGTKKWEFTTGAGLYFNSPALAADGTVYLSASDQRLYAVTPGGAKKWEFVGDGPFSASPVIGPDGTIYAGNDGVFDPANGSQRGRLYAIKPDGTKRWEFVTGDAIRSTPAIAQDGTIYFGSLDTKFYAVNPNGTERWELAVGTPIESSSAIRFDGVVYFGADDGTLYAVQGSSPLADSPWPMFQRDPRHTGNAGAPRIPDVWFYPFQSNAFDDQVGVIAVADGDVYVGGDFLVAGSLSANHIARWDGTAWSALGDGVNGSVRSIAVLGSNVFAGGYFTRAGNVDAQFIAKWDGAAWSALGDGSRENVDALAVLGNKLYAGRSFTNASGVTVNGVSKWDGQAWTPVGQDLNGTPLALASDGVRLYAGGASLSPNNLLVWDGDAWSPVGGGIVGSAWAVVVAGTDLYVGGDIWRAGGLNGVAVSGIAKWNGNAWSNLGGGMTNRGILSPYVFAIAAVGGDVYAGGGFLGAGGVPANSIARWDGVAWHPLAGGVAGDVPGNSGSIRALAVSGDSLYAGGVFYAAGGDRNIRHFARWDTGGWAAVGPLLSFVDGKFQLTLTDQIGRTYGIEASSDLRAWTRVATYTNIGGVIRFIDNTTTNSTQKFYRAVTP
jgi:outer membrane protein assembly factor BamB